MEGASSDYIVVDNFHPKWQEAAQKLMGGRVVDLMNAYSQSVSEWSGVPMSLDFTDEHGLTHVRLPSRMGLDLWPQDRKYRSHNINSVQNVGATTAIISEYVNWMKWALKEMGE